MNFVPLLCYYYFIRVTEIPHTVGVWLNFMLSILLTDHVVLVFIKNATLHFPSILLTSAALFFFNSWPLFGP